MVEIHCHTTHNHDEDNRVAVQICSGHHGQDVQSPIWESALAARPMPRSSDLNKMQVHCPHGSGPQISPG